MSTFLVLLQVVGSSGCTNRQVKVQMKAGSDGAVRVFESNLASRAEIARMSKAYEDDPSRRGQGGGVRFEGVFEAGDLPSEVGNRNGLSRLTSDLGTSWYYFEQFGERANDWDIFRQRMDAGNLWLNLAAKFFESRMSSEEAKEEWREFAYGRMIPDMMSGYLRYNAGQFVTTGQRISSTVRLPNDRGPRTMDESFQVSVFAPLTAFAAERGWMTIEEAQIIGLLGIDGWVSAGERDWSRRVIFEPLMKRVIQRFVPDAEPGEIDRNNQKMILIGLSFLWWVNTSGDAADVLLASDAITDEDKDRLRNGNRLITIPGPFGFSIRGGPRPLESELVVETGAKPFLTNGDWDESMGTVTFKSKVYPPEGRRRIAPPVYHASWAVADREAQETIFGSVVLKDQSLAEYCLWVKTLEGNNKRVWSEALAEAKSRSDTSSLLSALRRIDGDKDESRPPPTSLVTACTQ